MKAQRYFLALFFLTWVALNVLLGLCVPLRRWMVSIPYLLIVETINISLAYEFTLLLCVTFLPGKDLPKLINLETSPNVALLYLSFNDAMREALARLSEQNYSQCDVFVLDDSTDADCRALVDRYPYPVIRRENRAGQKAGAINHWLAAYGSGYDYFVVLDNDTILGPQFVENVLKYAEHPKNADVAMFQSSIYAWNTDRLFPYLMGANANLVALLSLRVLNQTDSMLCTGHNMMCRTNSHQEIGGFVEEFATEDFSTTLRLREAGYRCQAVDVVSYDCASETAWFHTSRLIRWSRGTLETALSKRWQIPLATQLRVFMSVHHYWQWFAYVLGALLAIWAYRLTWHQLRLLNFVLVRWGMSWRAYLPMIVIVSYLLYGVIIRPLWLCRVARIRLRDYWAMTLLAMALGYYSVYYVAVGQILSLLGSRARFRPANKYWYRTTLWQVLSEMRWSMLVSVLMVIGLYFNPVGRVLHLFWYAPLLLAPLIIVWIQNYPPKTSPGHEHPPALERVEGLSPTL
jgi:cellulose synthase/poly-beta-1,6-N-acetylglucosamine synthase-like glycosyltransferase